VSLALARKYRPATFDDLVGQESVSQTLSLALDKERLSHAYLFSGLRGSGKTSTARIFAKALLCETGPTAHPCRKCTHCKMAEEGTHMDIIEMDAASNRGIEDIKELIEHTKYQPSSARYKIFIIDEVHMLTNQAFNALLKTLEEPPNFVKFILATTDPLKLPATILSRTQHFRFKKIPQPLIEAHLEHILNLEEVAFENDAITMLARTGAGSLRDSLTLLDQAIVYAKNFVDVATVTQMLGIIEPSLLEQLIEDIMQKETHKVLDFVKLASDYEAEMILDELTLYLKSLLLNKSTAVPPLIIERFFRVLAEAKQLLSLGSDGEFVLSLTLFKMIEALEIKEIESMIKLLEKELSTLPQPTDTPQTTKEALPPKENVVPIVPKEEPTPKAEKSEEPKEKETQPSPTSPDNSSTHPMFEQLKRKIYDRDYELGQLFDTHVTFLHYENNELTWESTAQNEERALLGKHFSLIKTFVQELFGVETKITNIAKKKPPNVIPTPSVTTSKNENTQTTEPPQEEVVANTENLPPHQHTPPQEPTDSQKTTDDSLMKSSCIAPETGDTEAAKEKDPSLILEEPMVKEAIALLNPKRVRIKRNS
jgi:DNA polymerase-3 subunit gamma/tau